MFNEIEYYILNENEQDRHRLCYHAEGAAERVALNARLKLREEFLVFITEWYERASNAGFLITEIDEYVALKQDVKNSATALTAKPVKEDDDLIPF